MNNVSELEMPEFLEKVHRKVSMIVVLLEEEFLVFLGEQEYFSL